MPALLDTIDSCSNFIGLMMITASSFMILENLQAVHVLVLSLIILGKRYSLYQFSAILCVLGGLLLVTFQEIQDSEAGADAEKEKSRDQVLLGMATVIVGQLFHACHCIFEEYIL